MDTNHIEENPRSLESQLDVGELAGYLGAPAASSRATHLPRTGGDEMSRQRFQEGHVSLAGLGLPGHACHNTSDAGRFLTMVDLTATQLAERLGVTTRRARDLLHSNAITGRQLANGMWLADGDAVARYEISASRGSGRTLDATTAWGLLWELSGLDANWLSASTRARVRRRIRESDVGLIAAAVSKRTRVHRFTAANAERASVGLIRTGRAAVSVLDTGLIEDSRQVAGYVPSGAIDDYARSHFMIPAAAGHDVIFENTLPIDYAGETMPPGVVAADLAMSTDTRERSAGLRALEEMRQRWLAAR